VKRSVFVIANPTHYLNAVELVNQFPDRFGHTVMIILTEYYPSILRQDELLGKNFWSERHVFDMNALGLPPSHPKTWRWLYTKSNEVILNGSVDEFIIGNLGDAVLYALLLKHHQRVARPIVLDDGTPTINIFTSRRNNTDYNRYHNVGWRMLLKNIVGMSLVLPLSRPIPRLEFFTMFRLKAGENDVVTHNAMSVIGNMYEGMKPDPNKVLFVGSHIVEKGLVSEEVYLQSLLKVVREYAIQGKVIQYIKHRGQSSEMLAKIASIIEVNSFEMPMEFALKTYGIPGEVAGFFSTALFSLRGIHKTIKITSYRFPDAEIMGSYQESKKDILAIYESLEADPGIQVIRLA
jgi:arsenate reductase-like glutaredoxin family protein